MEHINLLYQELLASPNDMLVRMALTDACAETGIYCPDLLGREAQPIPNLDSHCSFSGFRIPNTYRWANSLSNGIDSSNAAGYYLSYCDGQERSTSRNSKDQGIC